MVKDTWNPDRRLIAAVTNTCRMTGLMLLCWCALFTCSKAAILVYDVMWKWLGLPSPLQKA
ncbi:hypothetical protein [Paenibacillus sp.]|uniref:hypothetical protein n=1 Tax=Paenibacillus sp. TaxID=58172 RepID=UPI002820FFFC|nr:hypothetical protein [Paenibacillus sp.]MDR0266727.1 hypothetical protein [Paenibacillus sp.]